MQRVLVTGGAGFIGSQLCRQLLEGGYHVICIDNFLTSSKQNIENLLDLPHFTFIEHDVIKPLEGKENVFTDLAAIFHLASPASPNQKSARSYIAYPLETLLVNSQGTQNVLELAKRTKAKFLFASTSEVYGDPAISPQTEDYFGNVNPNGVRSVYDEAKRFGEAITFAYLRKFDVDARIIRIFNTYGPRMQKDDGRVVSNFINQALEQKALTIYGNGTQTRSFCYVNDLVDGILLAMFTEGTKGEVMNLGNPDERTIQQLAIMIKELTGSTSDIVFEPLPEDDPKKRQPNIEKAKRLLGWEPKVPIEEGLTKTISYFNEL